MKRLEPLTGVLLESCKSVYGTDLVTLAVFGSWARGVATPTSDIDVLIVADNLPKGRTPRLGLFEEVDSATDTQRERIWSGAAEVPQLSPIFKTREEVLLGSPLFLDMTEWRLILWDPSGFFASYLERLRRRMKTLGTRRIGAKGGYYWEYKPDLKPGEVVEL
jgi:uncharacterized protein